jgi:hypothetical protein
LGFRTHIKNFIIIISFDAVDYLAVGGLTEWAAGGDLRPLKDAGKTIGMKARIYK